MTASDVTDLILASSAGDTHARDRLMVLVYDELRGIAHYRLMHERSDHTLQTTALVHEAYLRLVKLDRIRWQNRAHFLAIAAQAVRRVLVDHAASRGRQKRGGGWKVVTLDDAVAVDDSPGELLALNDALDRFAAAYPRQANVVECRFFGGLNVDETAAALGISARTVKRDWELARAWLYRELADER